MPAACAVRTDIPLAVSTYNADPWLTLEQAAGHAQVHAVTLRRAIHANRLKAIRVNGGRVYRLRVSWIDAFLTNYQTDSE
ncbi:MAG: excisionase family DNA-binding protein [Acidobacteriota bacterium]